MSREGVATLGSRGCKRYPGGGCGAIALSIWSDRSDDSGAAQRLDLRRGVAGLAEDLVGVLAQRRRLALDARAAVREPKSSADQAHRPVARVDRLHHVAVIQLRVLRDLLDLPHRRAWHVGRREARL